MLGQPTGVFDRGARCIHSLQRNAVAQSVQQSIDVAFDAGAEELHEEGVAAHLRNLILDEKLYVRGQLGQSSAQPSGDLSNTAFDVKFGFATQIRHPSTVIASAAQR